jgi:hypothetical protein
LATTQVAIQFGPAHAALKEALSDKQIEQTIAVEVQDSGTAAGESRGTSSRGLRNIVELATAIITEQGIGSLEMRLTRIVDSVVRRVKIQIAVIVKIGEYSTIGSAD